MKRKSGRPASRPPASTRAATREAPRGLELALLLALTALAILVLLAGCRVEDETVEPATTGDPAEVAPQSYTPGEATTPLSDYGRYDPERIEAERLDLSWQEPARADREARLAAIESRAPRDGETEAGRPPTAADRAGNPVLARLQERPGQEAEEGPDGPSRDGAGSGAPPESWDQIAPEAFQDWTPRFPIATEGGGPTVLSVQTLLDRARFSPGVIDGRWGKNTQKAVYWLQDSLGMEPTGEVDRALYDRLQAAVGEADPVRRHRLTSADLQGPFTDIPEETEAKAELECLCYSSPEELLAEKFHTTPELLGQLNPQSDLAALQAGDSLWVPAVEAFDADVKGGGSATGGTESPVARLVISKGGFYLHALDEQGNVLFHLPSTLGSEYDPSPEGELQVDAVGWQPDFHYQPKLFSDVPDTDEDLMLPAGPNSPVGVVWMQLSKEHYGIHGTAEPATIGYTSSHGCIRLTNWDAAFLAERVGSGTPVEFRQ